jgi:hypothetical protein
MSRRDRLCIESQPERSTGNTREALPCIFSIEFSATARSGHLEARLNVARELASFHAVPHRPAFSVNAVTPSREFWD